MAERQPGDEERIARRDELAAEHRPLVRQIALGIARNLSRAFDLDDLIQAGEIALLEAAADCDRDRRACFGRYAAIRIRGAMIGLIRRRAWREASHSRSDEARLVRDKRESPFDYAIRRQRRRALVRALAELPPRERRIVLLHHVHGVQQKELARLFDLSRSRINQIIQCSLARLQRSLNTQRR